jgi:hypothetical protein
MKKESLKKLVKVFKLSEIEKNDVLLIESDETNQVKVNQMLERVREELGLIMQEKNLSVLVVPVGSRVSELKMITNMVKGVKEIMDKENEESEENQDGEKNEEMK